MTTCYEFAVRLDYLARLLPCTSTEETRYYLMGVAVDFHPDGTAALVATDGHKLGLFRDETASASAPALASTH